MSPHAYLIHRATKVAPPSSLELELLDLDLAAAGVQLSWSASVETDDDAVDIAQRVIHDVLEAA